MKYVLVVALLSLSCLAQQGKRRLIGSGGGGGYSIVQVCYTGEETTSGAASTPCSFSVNISPGHSVIAFVHWGLGASGSFSFVSVTASDSFTIESASRAEGNSFNYPSIGVQGAVGSSLTGGYSSITFNVSSTATANWQGIAFETTGGVFSQAIAANGGSTTPSAGTISSGTFAIASADVDYNSGLITSSAGSGWTSHTNNYWPGEPPVNQFDEYRSISGSATADIVPGASPVGWAMDAISLH